jgi:hypothetical protein
LSTTIAPATGDVATHPEATELLDVEVLEGLTLNVERAVVFTEVVVTAAVVVEVFKIVAAVGNAQAHPLDSFEVFDLQADAHVGSPVVAIIVATV